jgi:hypothetical protein
MPVLDETVGFLVIGKYLDNKQTTFHPSEEEAKKWIAGFLEQCKLMRAPPGGAKPFVVLLPGINYREQ